jgi:hypothetical protein
LGLNDSENVNKQWAENQGSPLRILLLPANRCPGIVSRFQAVVLPEPFAQMQSAFDSFYRRLVGTEHLQLLWVFEDNVADLRIISDSYNLRLRVPLLLAVVLTIVYQYQNPTTDLIASKAKLAPAQVEAIVARAASSEFPILYLGDTGRVAFNRKLTTAGPRKIEIVIPQLSLRIPMSGHAAPQQEGSVDLRSVYQAQIVKVIKNEKAIDAKRLFLAVRNDVGERFEGFKKEEYDRTLIVLESNGFISRDPKDPGKYLYVP